MSMLMLLLLLWVRRAFFAKSFLWPAGSLCSYPPIHRQQDSNSQLGAACSMKTMKNQVGHAVQRRRESHALDD
jgi:hypothetical protein